MTAEPEATSDEPTELDQVREAWLADECTAEEFAPDEIATIEALAYQQGEYSETSIYALVTLADGRWGTVAAWCDTTGWGCQDDKEIRAWPSRDEAVRHGLDDEIRRLLGIPQPEGPA